MPRTGQPLRALAGLAAAVAAFELARVPAMRRDFAETVAALQTVAAARAAEQAHALSRARPLRPAGRAGPAAEPPMAVEMAAKQQAPAPGARAAVEPARVRPVPRSARRFGGGTGSDGGRQPAIGSGSAALPAPAILPAALPPPPPVSLVVHPPAPAPAAPVAPTVTLAAEAPAAATAFARATAAYAALGSGDRRAAARGFDAALAAAPDAANARAWAAARRQLGRRWSGDAYALFRDAAGSGLGASPVLGGAQAGASLGYTLDPLARRPFAIVARAAGALEPGQSFLAPRGIDRESVQLALGLRWRPWLGVSITVERLFAAGAAARDDWNVRLAAGTAGTRGRIAWSAYGEAGVLRHGDSYGGGQARIGVQAAAGPLTLAAGPGAWTSVQYTYAADRAIGRIDVGPSLAAHLPLGRAAIDLSADYRWRIAGGAAPGNGPAVTLSAAF